MAFRSTRHFKDGEIGFDCLRSGGSRILVQKDISGLSFVVDAGGISL